MALVTSFGLGSQGFQLRLAFLGLVSGAAAAENAADLVASGRRGAEAGDEC